ncbi:MAG: DUF721 domain-containing protein [Fimbriimonadaceae bacterium]|nr:DUF721 domain-containing protein [Fimbriimonadaceae bacterium]QYK52452.1 MAG: DUF721 domain-containing protein [Fimbriimonadaceae bacterium]
MKHLKRLSDILPEVFADGDVPKAARANIVMRQWEDAVGEILSKHSKPDRYDHGVIWVETTGSAWAQELRMRQTEILAKLNELAGERGLFLELKVTHRGKKPDMIR